MRPVCYKTQAAPPTTPTATAATTPTNPPLLPSDSAPELWPCELPLLELLGPVYVVAALGMVLMLPSKILRVLLPVNPPGTPVLIPVGGPVVGVQQR